MGALAESFAGLPEAQRFAFTTWGVRDRDSWRRREDPSQQPLLFDDDGEAKEAFWAVADAWS
jgi:endo-1,4-beta-xylanase